MSKPLTKTRLAWIRFRRNLRKTVVSRIGGRLDDYGHKIP